MTSILLQLTGISDYDNYEYIHLQLDIKRISSLDPLKMRTPCNGDFFTPIIVNREGGQIDARC